MKRLSFSIILILLIIAASDIPQAKVTGVCSNCHTMHYSQGGGQLSDWGSSGPYSALTTNTCVGCHTGIDAHNNGSNTTPYVMTNGLPTYGATGTDGDTLAGGSFYWMVTDKTTGHDVDGIATTFDMLPPGYPDADYDSNRPATWPGIQKVTCAGTYGCHGRTDTADQYVSARGGHHGDDTQTDGSTFEKSYRMLNGVAGKEWNTAGSIGGKWEFKPTNSKHNQYKGIDRLSETDINSSTISYLCGQCHGDFHSGTGNLGHGSPWLRHPTDYDMGNTDTGSEYRSYNTDGSTYSVVAPVASSDVTTVLATIDFVNNKAIVTCISCHRAHGSKYYKLMRWDNKANMSGCVVCHTTKS